MYGKGAFWPEGAWVTNTFLYCPGVHLALESIVAAETSACLFSHSTWLSVLSVNRVRPQSRVSSSLCNVPQTGVTAVVLSVIAIGGLARARHAQEALQGQ